MIDIFLGFFGFCDFGYGVLENWVLVGVLVMGIVLDVNMFSDLDIVMDVFLLLVGDIEV